MGTKELSFIIPALNEEEHIGGILDAIREQVDNYFKYEVIVVDNGSNDRTIPIAQGKGALCLNAPGVTISSLRNIGVTNAHSDILVFLDADVYLGKDWGGRMVTLMADLHRLPHIITGSLYGISEEENWIEKIWFAPRTTRKEVKYINGGHLIIHKSLFLKVGGFDPDLETGEDYEFCARAGRLGTRIKNNPELEVVHAGYPKTINKFFDRERWHGRGDYKSFRTALSSSPALISTTNLCLSIICIIGAVKHPHSWLQLLYVYSGFLVTVSLAAAFYRCRDEINYGFLGIIFLYIIYFSARTVSLVDVFVDRFLSRRKITPQKEA